MDIDINPERPEQQDVISNFDLWAAAIVVLDYCVAGHGGQNGYLDGLGMSNSVGLRAGAFMPPMYSKTPKNCWCRPRRCTEGLDHELLPKSAMS